MIENPMIFDGYVDENKVVYECYECGSYIYEGDNCYKFDSRVICSDCVDDCRIEAEKEDWTA